MRSWILKPSSTTTIISIEHLHRQHDIFSTCSRNKNDILYTCIFIKYYCLNNLYYIYILNYMIGHDIHLFSYRNDHSFNTEHQNQISIAQLYLFRGDLQNKTPLEYISTILFKTHKLLYIQWKNVKIN